jgi:hypothetical protein
MSLAIDVDRVKAVLLSDGWHAVENPELHARQLRVHLVFERCREGQGGFPDDARRRP